MISKASRGNRPPGSGDPVPGAKPGSIEIDVEGQVDGLAAFPGHLEGNLRELLRAMLVEVMHGENARAAPLGNGGARPVAVPAADPDLHQVLWMAIGQADIVHMAVVAMRGDAALMGGPEPGRRVHPLIHILLLDIDMAIDVDDADIAVDMRCDPPDIGKAEAVIAAANDRKDP